VRNPDGLGIVLVLLAVSIRQGHDYLVAWC